jgi:hypothetical protein
MPITLNDVQRIAADVAQREDERLEVVAAVPAEGESTYTEVVLTVRGCAADPCMLVIGLTRGASESEIRNAVKDGLQRHLEDHPPGRDAHRG